MKFYPATFNFWTLYKKYILDLDNEITSIVNFLDFINPNYIVLNNEYTSYGLNFFNNDQLQHNPLQYISFSINPETDEKETTIYLNKLYNHFIIFNNFGRGTADIVYQDETIDYLQEGFALIARGKDLNGNPLYSIVSLDSSGAFYVLYNTAFFRDNNQDWIAYEWRFNQHATDEIGSQYILSLTPPGSRYFYHPEGSSHNSWKEITTPSIITYAKNTDHVFIATEKLSHWTTGSLLGYEICTTTNNTVEQVFCDEQVTVSNTIADSQSVARHRVNTNYEPCYGVNFYINYY